MKRGRDVEEIMISSSSEDDEVEEESEDVYEVGSDDTDDEEQYNDEELDDEEDDDEDASDSEDDYDEDLDSSLSDDEDEDEDEDDDDYAESSDSQKASLGKTNRGIASGFYGSKVAKSGQERRRRREQIMKSTSRKTISSAEDQKEFFEALHIIREGVFEKLKLENCKAYLRNYSLRLTGSISLLRDRVREHFELKTHGGIAKYPRSTFSLDCTGDACTADVVLFRQRVKPKKYNAGKCSTLPHLVKRIVAGRIVKESYGSDKQQHTFTVEVLWTKGPNRLPVLYPLLIKGRNLYRFRTFRQPWPNEGEREKVLQEKHLRGVVARKTRDDRVSGKQYSSMTRTKFGKSIGILTVRRERKETARSHRKTSKVAFSGKENKKRSHGSRRALTIKACYAGALIGTKGRNIDEIKRSSGAVLHVCDHPSSRNLRLVEIVGEPEQVQVATQMVVQIFSSKGFQLPVEITNF